MLCRNRLVVFAWDINMRPPAIVKMDTHHKHKFTLLAIYFFVGDFAILFLFREFFQADQGCLTFERLGLLVSLHFTE